MTYASCFNCAKRNITTENEWLVNYCKHCKGSVFSADDCNAWEHDMSMDETANAYGKAVQS